MALLKPSFFRLQRGHSLARGLVGAWEFTENSGNIAYDSSDYGRHGTLTGGPTWVGGRAGSAISLSGASQYITAPILNITTFLSIISWVYLNANQNGYTAVISWRNGVTLATLGISYGDTTANQLGYMWDGAQYDWNSGIILPNNKWVLIAAVVSAANAVVYMHDDTKLERAVNTVSAAAVNFNASGGIGTDIEDPALRAVNGLIDCVRIYDRELSWEEIRFIYTEDSRGLFRSASETLLAAIAGQAVLPPTEGPNLRVVQSGMRW